MDGFTFVKKVIDRDGLEISTLLNKLGKKENSAIEFKVTFLPTTDSDDEPDAYSWNVISDIIAIANSSGGCILLGVNDDGEFAEGYHGTLSLDEYKRCLEDHLKNKAHWSFNNRVYEIKPEYRENLFRCIESGIYEGKLNGNDILIIHIHPTDSKSPIIFETRRLEEKKENTKEYLTYRSYGAVARKTTTLATINEIIKFTTHLSDSDYYN